MKVVVCKVYKLAEAYIEQEKLIETDNTLFATESSIQSDEINDEVDIKDPEVDIVTKNSEVSEATAVIYIDLTTYNIMNLPTHTDKFKTDSIDLPLLKALIVTIASEALKAGNVTMIDLITNITTELSIQSKEILLNQATALCCQSTCVRQPTKCMTEAEASRQHKQFKRA